MNEPLSGGGGGGRVVGPPADDPEPCGIGSFHAGFYHAQLYCHHELSDVTVCAECLEDLRLRTVQCERCGRFPRLVAVSLPTSAGHRALTDDRRQVVAGSALSVRTRETQARQFSSS